MVIDQCLLRLLNDLVGKKPNKKNNPVRKSLIPQFPAAESGSCGGGQSAQSRAGCLAALACVTLLTGGLAFYLIFFGKPTTDEERLAQAIKEAGGKVVVDETRPDKPVVKVICRSEPRVKEKRIIFPWRLTTSEIVHYHFTDSQLKVLVPLLLELPHLLALDLRHTDITDKGLALLLELPHLRALDLTDTDITDKGLEQLKGLVNLETLRLGGVPPSTRLTKGDVEALRKALPRTKIVFENFDHHITLPQ